MIDLRKIKSYWMTCVKTRDRWPEMEEMLSRLEIPAEKYIGSISEPYTLGVAAAYLDVLENNSAPILFLEDDARDLEAYTPILEPENNADGIWIGTSLYGRPGGITTLGGAAFEPFDDKWLKLKGMLSLHAFVVVSERYREFLISLLKEFKGGGVDDQICEKMADWNIYGARSPFFYQNDGHSTWPTTFPLENLL
jgi:hypothetical protein